MDITAVDSNGSRAALAVSNPPFSASELCLNEKDDCMNKYFISLFQQLKERSLQ
jgi:hypothetical protein